jgi:hypothetical protein
MLHSVVWNQRDERGRFRQGRHVGDRMADGFAHRSGGAPVNDFGPPSPPVDQPVALA